MEHIDDMMQRAFSTDDPTSRFEFKEAYWLQAEALIEAYERRRRRALWWKRAGYMAGLIALAWSGWWYTHLTTAPLVPPGTPVMQGAPAGTSTTAPIAADTQQSGVYGAPDAARGHESTNTSAAATPAEQPEVTRLKSGTTAQKGVAGQRSGDISTFRNTKIGAASASGILATASNPLDDTKNNQNSTIGQPSGIVLTSNQHTNGASLITSTENPAFVAPTKTSDNNPNQTGSTVPAKPVLPELLNPLPVAPIASVQSQTPPPVLVIVVPEFAPATIAPIVKKVPRQRLQWGLLVGVETSGPLQGDRRADFSLGITTRYALGEHWQLNTGLHARWRPDHLLLDLDTLGVLEGGNIAKVYDFGYTEQRRQSTFKHATWFELPVSVGYRVSKRWMVEAGVMPSVLLGAARSSEYYRSESLQPVERLIVSDTEFITNGGNLPYKRVAMSGFVGFQWMPTKQLALGMSIFAAQRYRTLTTVSVSESQLSPNWHADLQVRYFLFKR
jgi:hypothetical protein